MCIIGYPSRFCGKLHVHYTGYARRCFTKLSFGIYTGARARSYNLLFLLPFFPPLFPPPFFSLFYSISIPRRLNLNTQRGCHGTPRAVFSLNHASIHYLNRVSALERHFYTLPLYASSRPSLPSYISPSSLSFFVSLFSSFIFFFVLLLLSSCTVRFFFHASLRLLPLNYTYTDTYTHSMFESETSSAASWKKSRTMHDGWMSKTGPSSL